MDKVNKPGLMKLFILAITEMEENTVKVNSCGLMIVHMKEIFLKIISMALENMNGRMEESTKVNGKIIKCKEKVLSPGLMVENTLEIILKIVNKALEFSHLKMEEYMKGSGLMENNMAEEFLKRKTFHEREFGKMEKESGGWMNKNKMVKQKNQKKHRKFKKLLDNSMKRKNKNKK